MGMLHDEFERAMGERWTDKSMTVELLRHVTKGRGLTISDEQLSAFAEAIAQGADSIELPGDGPDQSIEITNEEVERAMREVDAAQEAGTEGAVSRVVEEIAPRILQSLYAALPETMGEWHAAQRAFEERLYDRWKEGLDRLDMLITMAHEAGEAFIEDLNRSSSDEEAPPDPALIEVLTALHCRACRTAREIVCLLKAGYADGAHARWRSLHELAVTAYFIQKHPTGTPQLYLDHAAVERYRATQHYQQHCRTLGYDPYSPEELEEMKRASDAAIATYGQPFREDYGWAATALGNPRPNFAQIEASIDMAHWRPWFRLACQSVHAGSRSLHSALGIPQDAPDMRLAGASDAGLADPGHQMAISLTMVTIVFLNSHPNIDGLVTCNCMLKVSDDIGREMLRIHDPEEAADASSGCD